MNVPKILVTGANGFIGQALCRRLSARGWWVRGAVRSPEQLKRLPADVDAVLIDSIGPLTDWSNALSDINTVVHLAATLEVINRRPSDCLAQFRKVNVLGTEHLARMAASREVNRFVFTSSIKANGEGQPTAYTEEDEPAPADHLGLSKWEAELVLNHIAAETGMDVLIFRFPLVYGPGVKSNFLRLLKTVHGGTPLPLKNIHNQRSLIYLENLLDGIIKCIGEGDPVAGTYILGDGNDVSTPDLIRRIATALDTSPRLFPFPPSLLKVAAKLLGKKPAVDKLLGTLTVDPSKFQRALNWKPPYSMDQGLKATAKWYMARGVK